MCVCVCVCVCVRPRAYVCSIVYCVSVHVLGVVRYICVIYITKHWETTVVEYCIVSLSLLVHSSPTKGQRLTTTLLTHSSSCPL